MSLHQTDPSRNCASGAWSRIRRFSADRAASAAIDFSLVLFPFMGLLGMTIDVGLLYFRSAQLQMTTEIASRQLLTHGMVTPVSYQDFIDRYVCTWQSTGVVQPGTLSKMFDCSKLVVDIRSPASWTDATENEDGPPLNTSLISVPSAGQIAVVRIMYPSNRFFRFSGWKNYTQDELIGVSAFRVEP